MKELFYITVAVCLCIIAGSSFFLTERMLTVLNDGIIISGMPLNRNGD